MTKTHNILVTRELSDEQLRLAESIGLNVVVEPAIRIEFRNDWLAFESILKETEKPVFAFTSRNGVAGFERFRKAGVKINDDAPVYAVGGKTSEALNEIGFSDVKSPVQQDGVGLAHLIINDFLQTRDFKDATVLHFCGDRRRNELRHYLTDSDIPIKDIVVYRTELNEMNLPGGKFDAVLFYSPSAVQAYRNSGGFSRKEDLPELFAIGNTTAEELSIESGQHVHVSPEPDTEVYLRFVARILNEQKPAKECPPSKGAMGDEKSPTSKWGQGDEGRANKRWNDS